MELENACGAMKSPKSAIWTTLLPPWINLQILKFLLKFVIKVDIKWAHIAAKYCLNHIQKENSQNVDLRY